MTGHDKRIMKEMFRLMMNAGSLHSRLLVHAFWGKDVPPELLKESSDHKKEVEDMDKLMLDWIKGDL